jgi:hypothetical protein
LYSLQSELPVTEFIKQGDAFHLIALIDLHHHPLVLKGAIK